MDELAKSEKLGDLYAYYGPLLTKGQREYFEDYYYNDLSLGEIADNHHVTRQAVYDNLKRSSRALEKYEKKLHMQKDYQELSNLAWELASAVDHHQFDEAHDEVGKLLKKLGEME
ncbi:YlxM family DNA-binding protein [Lactobacillus sp.]|uniref:YlxM family DNA-binding protein n=1 Tax=Lactobacillus sp. TaxID=1591 RepID=UPI0019981C13|nr:transcriptional regulator [Lactobacillus sp.]MBD5428992.1 transcriptional regulator [Lactobacillus sp.]